MRFHAAGFTPAVRVLGAAVALAACGGHDTAHTPRVGKALAAALGAADHARAPWRCAALDTPELAAGEITAGAQRWELAGHAVKGGAKDATIALVADAGGGDPRTLAALGRLRATLDREAPELVIALGGMGRGQAELEATLGALADHAPWLVVALPGDLEATSAHVAAVAALRGKGAPIIDGRLARWLELPGAILGTVPGAGSVARLVAGADGCAWTAGDVAKLQAELAGKPGLRIVLTSEAPRQLVAGEPTGELALLPATAQPVDLIIHGPTQAAPSPARQGRRDGKGIPLTPGTADATPRWEPHAPSAGLLAIRGATWSWRPILDGK